MGLWAHYSLPAFCRFGNWIFSPAYPILMWFRDIYQTHKRLMYKPEVIESHTVRSRAVRYAKDLCSPLKAANGRPRTSAQGNWPVAPMTCASSFVAAFLPSCIQVSIRLSLYQRSLPLPPSPISCFVLSSRLHFTFDTYYSVTQCLFIEHLLCSSLCSRHWGDHSEYNR